MPPLSTLQWTLWIAGAILQPVLCVSIRSHKMQGLWQSVFRYMAFRTIDTFLLISINLLIGDLDLRARVYFYAYWIGNFFASILEFLVVSAIAQELFGVSKKARVYIWWAITLFPALCAACAIPFSSVEKFSGQLVRVNLEASRVCTFAWFATFAFVSLAADFVGLRYRRHALWISAGFLLELCTNAVRSWAAEMLPLATLNTVESCVYLICLALWLSLTFTPESLMDVSPNPSDLGRLASSLIGALKRIKA